jgi:hypothetical protein
MGMLLALDGRDSLVSRSGHFNPEKGALSLPTGYQTGWAPEGV